MMIEKTLVETVKNLCRDGLEDDARKFVLESMSDLATEELWSNIDLVLVEIAADDFKDHPLILLAFLSSTFAFANFLKRRQSLFWATKRVLSDKFDRQTVDSLLVGLS